MSVEPLVLLEDEPIADLAHDGLQLCQYADVVAGAAKGTAGPFTIGVYGGWGSGKTSLLRLAGQMLREDPDAKTRIVTVHFNAWQYEHEEHPLVPLVATIAAAVDLWLKERPHILSEQARNAGLFIEHGQHDAEQGWCGGRHESTAA